MDPFVEPDDRAAPDHRHQQWLGRGRRTTRRAPGSDAAIMALSGLLDTAGDADVTVSLAWGGRRRNRITGRGPGG